MAREILSELVVDSAHNLKEGFPPRMHPVHHVNDRCYCDIFKAEVETYRKQQPNTLVGHTEGVGSEPDVRTQGNKAYLSINFPPTGQRLVQLQGSTNASCNLHISNTNGGLLITTVDSPGYPTTTEMTGEEYGSGGFLSLRVDAAKNMYFCVREQWVTHVAWKTKAVGSIGNAWAGMSVFINEGGDCGYCGIRCCEMAGSGPFGTGNGRNNHCGLLTDPDFTPGCRSDEWHWNIAPIFGPEGAWAHLLPGKTYVFSSIYDPGYTIAQRAPALSPPGLQFIKSQIGDVTTGHEGQGGPWDVTGGQDPNCDLAWVSLIYSRFTPPDGNYNFTNYQIRFGSEYVADAGGGYYFVA